MLFLASSFAIGDGCSNGVGNCPSITADVVSCFRGRFLCGCFPGGLLILAVLHVSRGGGGDKAGRWVF